MYLKKLRFRLFKQLNLLNLSIMLENSLGDIPSQLHIYSRFASLLWIYRKSSMLSVVNILLEDSIDINNLLQSLWLSWFLIKIKFERKKSVFLYIFASHWLAWLLLIICCFIAFFFSSSVCLRDLFLVSLTTFLLPFVILVDFLWKEIERS